jgi:ribose transport system permease protein
VPCIVQMSAARGETPVSEKEYATNAGPGTISRPLRFLQRLFLYRNTSLVLFLVIIWIILANVTPYFFKADNIVLILRQSTTVGIMGIGMTMVIISGGIDLSVGAVAALSAMIDGILLMKLHLPFIVALVGALGVGVCFGIFNGLLVSRFRLQPMVVTLGTMSIARGLTLISTSGRPIFVLNPTMMAIGNGELLGVPIQVYVVLGLFLAGLVALNLTYFGRYVYSIGGNEEATRLSGIFVQRYKVFLYVITGFCASIVGIVLVGLLGASEPTTGIGLELDAIAVSAIGGTSLMGGVGGLGGTMLGALLIGTLKNGLTILNVVSYYQQVLIGVVIIMAVLIDSLRKR